MNDSMKLLLKNALMKYGAEEHICSSTELKRDWERDAYFDTAYPPKNNDLYIRDTLIGQGRILEEDLSNHIYVDLVKVGLTEAMLVTKAENAVVHIAAYAKEGLIRQHLSEKAVKHIKKLLEG